MNDTPLGFEVPVHRALTTEPLIGGVPRRIAVATGTLILALVMYGQGFWARTTGLLVGLFVHMLIVRACKKDDKFFRVILRAIRLKSFYRG